MIIVLIFLVNCKEGRKKEEKLTTSKIQIFDYYNKEELNRYRELNLIEEHSKLLNLKTSEDTFKKVKASFNNLHQQIGKYLLTKNFDWKVVKVSVFHRFYFEANGKKACMFRTLNDSVTALKRKEYANLLFEFANQQKINFQNDIPFTQCGTTEYVSK